MLRVHGTKIIGRPSLFLETCRTILDSHLIAVENQVVEIVVVDRVPLRAARGGFARSALAAATSDHVSVCARDPGDGGCLRQEGLANLL